MPNFISFYCTFAAFDDSTFYFVCHFATNVIIICANFDNFVVFIEMMMRLLILGSNVMVQSTSEHIYLLIHIKLLISTYVYRLALFV